MIKVEHLYNALEKQFPKARITLADSCYTVVTPSSIRSIGNSLKKALSNLYWIQDNFDCNAYALLACGLMKLAHSLTTKEQVAVGFGFIYYTTKSGMRHAINCALAKRDNTYVLDFYEPQMSLDPLVLCESELSSISDVVFP